MPLLHGLCRHTSSAIITRIPEGGLTTLCSVPGLRPTPFHLGCPLVTSPHFSPRVTLAPSFHPSRAEVAQDSPATVSSAAQCSPLYSLSVMPASLLLPLWRCCGFGGLTGRDFIDGFLPSRQHREARVQAPFPCRPISSAQAFAAPSGTCRSVWFPD